ncbi:hypothetical protein A3D62_01115 [Candidatus Kaiserbacteria bacterium RIFCSPHIGHO2_02_FULL_49_11]|uniref:YdbS-like PH domain-containing protein n=1 Tax=Candidatus Kaiserbacteria bacterium RIFCSPHIGHO2_02_FULL_49_11 TaxID=1798489 RepID=A0A1F6D0Z4_9BACT|nr:MAG: hypothetical protein A3D62_01115 [Candidatus Kaiserbacteria bacterium RIFCSPHIGHO2_02_FULL_49_11]
MIYLQEGEQVEAKVHKHWFILFRDSLGVLIMFAIPFIGWEFFTRNGTIEAMSFPINPALLTFLASLWALFMWLRFFAIWTDYYLDIWIVTDQRVVNIDQKSLFRREVSTLRMERVQDISIEVDGIIATVLNFGTIRVQSAGESKDFLIEGIANPESIKRKILARMDALESPVQFSKGV